MNFQNQFGYGVRNYTVSKIRLMIIETLSSNPESQILKILLILNSWSNFIVVAI